MLFELYLWMIFFLCVWYDWFGRRYRYTVLMAYWNVLPRFSYTFNRIQWWSVKCAQLRWHWDNAHLCSLDRYPLGRISPNVQIYVDSLYLFVNIFLFLFFFLFLWCKSFNTCPVGYYEWYFTTSNNQWIPIILLCCAIFSLLKRIRNVTPLPPQCMFYLFQSLVEPILLYGSDVWGLSTCAGNKLDSVMLSFIRNVLHVKSTTSNVISVGETGQILPSTKSHMNVFAYFVRLRHLPKSMCVKMFLMN